MKLVQDFLKEGDVIKIGNSHGAELIRGNDGWRDNEFFLLKKEHLSRDTGPSLKDKFFLITQAEQPSTPYNSQTVEAQEVHPNGNFKHPAHTLSITFAQTVNTQGPTPRCMIADLENTDVEFIGHREPYRQFGPMIPVTEDDLQKQDIKDLSVKHFGFTERTKNALRSNGIETIGELLQFSEDALKHMPKIGPRTKTFREIKDRLEEEGLKLPEISAHTIEMVNFMYPQNQ